jgi:hypothetical protein
MDKHQKIRRFGDDLLMILKKLQNLLPRSILEDAFLHA